jgi:hypothetical protein
MYTILEPPVLVQITHTALQRSCQGTAAQQQAAVDHTQCPGNTQITAMSLIKDEERLELLKEIGGTKVYEERRRDSLKVMHETEGRRVHIEEVVSRCHVSIHVCLTSGMSHGGHQPHTAGQGLNSSVAIFTAAMNRDEFRGCVYPHLHGMCPDIYGAHPCGSGAKRQSSEPLVQL